MGRFVSMYLLDLDNVHNVIGCRDDAVYRFVTERRAREFASDAQYFEHDVDSAVPSLEDALRTVIAGGPYGSEHAYRHNVVYREICEAFAMSTSGNGPYRGDWLSQVDEGFRELGVDAIAFTEFEYGTPGNLPHQMDGGYGEWTHHECVNAVAQWESSTPAQLAALDPEMREWIEMGIGFAYVAANSPGWGIAGFFDL